MSICAFNSLPKGQYSNFFIVPTFSNKSFSGRTSLPVKSWYLLSFPDYKPEILAVCLSKKIILSFVLLDFVIGCFDFLTNTHCYNKFFANHNGLSDDKVVPFTKNEYGF